MKAVKRLFKKRVSNIHIASGQRRDLFRQYAELLGNPDIRITSVSITKDYTGYGRTEQLMLAISYDYWK